MLYKLAFVGKNGRKYKDSIPAATRLTKLMADGVMYRTPNRRGLCTVAINIGNILGKRVRCGFRTHLSFNCV